MKRILIWYRNDLRLHDHEPLSAAIRKADEVIPFYCFDTRQFARTAYGFPKTGPLRAQFIIECVENLSRQLRKAGGRLRVQVGLPEELIPQCAAEYGIEAVYTYKEATDEEVRVEEALEHQLWKRRVPLVCFPGRTLYHPGDLPFPLRGLPEVFTEFRKQVERQVAVRPALPVPRHVETPPGVPVPAMPSLRDLGLPDSIFDERAAFCFAGGEEAALERLNHYLWEGDLLRAYKHTRNNLLGADFSSKLSPWLAQGCLSPRLLYGEVKRYERERVKNESTYWMVFELLWRDYFRFIARKHGKALFRPGGIRGRSVPPPAPLDAARFAAWREGRTGVPFVDACMAELLHTGYLAGRGRQIAASFLVHDLGLDWRAGAAWFESQLLDYDPCSNYGNWNYVAGIGNDPRENRYFHVVKQARQYDPDGAYVKRWLPVLAALPPAAVHAPHRLPAGELEKYGVRPGKNYPHPLAEVRDAEMQKSE